MAASKKIARAIAGLMAAAVTLCICAVGFSGEIAAAQSGGVTMEYASRLFGTDQVLGVNILMEEAQWTDMLQNAIEEEYYPCDVEIGGTRWASAPRGIPASLPSSATRTPTATALS